MTEKSPGTWRLRAYVGRDPVTGNPIQKFETFRGSTTAARKALAALVTKAEKERSRFLEPSKATVGELLDAWLEHIEKRGRAPKTVYEYRRKIEGRIRPALGKVRIESLQPRRLDALYAAWLSEGLSPSTVRVYHSILSAAFHQAVKWGWVDHSPTDRATAPTAASPTMKVPTPAQLATLVREAEDEDPVLAAAIMLAALTGVRRGELVALRWSDVDLAAGVVRVERAITVVDKVTHEGPTKTHQTRRVALDEIGVEALRRHWSFVTNLSADAESPLVEDPYVLSYSAHSGIPVNGDTLTHRFAALCKRVEGKKAKTRKKGVALELYNFHFHELRHFSVTTLLAAGVDVRTVSERAGHRRATMTLNVYAHALPERDRAAAGILGKALAPA